MSIKDLAATLNAPGNVFDLRGRYTISKPLTIKKSITITGDSQVTPLYSKKTGYAISFQGKINHIQGLTYDAQLKTPGLRITGDAMFRGGVLNTVKVGTTGADAVNGLNAIDCTRLELWDFVFQNIYGSGLSASNSNNITVKGGFGISCCQFYPSGGAIHADEGCRNVLVDGFEASGDTMNDGVYVGTSRDPIPGVVVKNCNIHINELPGGKYQGAGIKMYGKNGLMMNNKIQITKNGYGLEDWGTDDTIIDNVIDGGSHGIGLFGSSKVPVARNKIINCPKPYDNNGKYTIAKA